MSYAVLLDFGSTYTKVTCVDTIEKSVVINSKVPSTVDTDATIALEQCFEIVKQAIGNDNFERALKLSSSSAAGGLKVAVVGLTESLSIEAGRNACFGAGGKVVNVLFGEIEDDDIEKIRRSNADIILLCGGYEGGNHSKVIRNAEKISSSMLNIPVVYAGNSYVASQIRRLFIGKGQECFITENIIPDIGKLNIEPTVAVIRNLFMNRIINMKGIGRISEALDSKIIPTPLAVLNAGKLLFEGTDTNPGAGPYMLVDIGGATTDIYSFCENKSADGAKLLGVPEPTVKRTVEGDIGMRESSISLLKEVGLDAFSKEFGLRSEQIDRAVNKRITRKDYVADDPIEKKIDYMLASKAVSISAARHAGKLYREIHDEYRIVQRGKNLQSINIVVGTGGILVNSPIEVATAILKNVTKSDNELNQDLLPADVDVKVDEDYVFYAAGLLSEYDKETAFEIIRKSIMKRRISG